MHFDQWEISLSQAQDLKQNTNTSKSISLQSITLFSTLRVNQTLQRSSVEHLVVTNWTHLRFDSRHDHTIDFLFRFSRSLWKRYLVFEDISHTNIAISSLLITNRSNSSSLQLNSFSTLSTCQSIKLLQRSYFEYLNNVVTNWFFLRVTLQQLRHLLIFYWVSISLIVTSQWVYYNGANKFVTMINTFVCKHVFFNVIIISSSTSMKRCSKSLLNQRFSTSSTQLKISRLKYLEFELFSMISSSTLTITSQLFQAKYLALVGAPHTNENNRFETKLRENER